MIKKIEHIGIIANDMEVSVKFYVDLLGFTVEDEVTTYDKHLMFLVHPSMPEFSIELIAEKKQTTVYSNQGLVNHLAFAVDRFDEVMQQLKDQGVVFERESPKYGRGSRKTIRFKGPSGEVLQLVEFKEH